MKSPATIQKEHEILCGNCGCVLGQVEEIPEITIKPTITQSINVQILGSALTSFAKKQYRDPQQVREDNVRQQLLNIIKHYNLPERLAIETFNQLKKNKRGFQSQKEPIKQLLKIMAKDENYIHIHKMRAIKSRYENLTD